jgi:branched-chain amino acid transport system substrate-binding protein
LTYPDDLKALRPPMIFWFYHFRAAAAPWLAVLALVLIAGCDTSRTRGELQDAQVPTPQAAPPAPPDAAALLRAAGPIDLIGGQAMPPYVPGSAGAVGADAGTQNVERIALLLPLSGRFAYLGKPMLNAAQLAVFDVAGEQFELMVFDTAGEPDQASEAARTAIEQGARLIIGPLLAESTRAAAPWAQAAGVPLLSFSSDRTVAGNGVFILGFTPGDQVERVIQYASGRGIGEFAVIAPEDAYGNLVVQAVQDAAARVGGRVTDVRFVDRDLSGASFAIQAVGASPTPVASPDVSPAALPGNADRALLIAEGGERLRFIADLLQADGVAPAEIQILGTGTWDEPWISGEPALVGGWFAAPPPWARDRFVQNYARTYGETPPRLAGLAYDATALAAIVGQIIGGMDLTPDVLTTPAGFIGSEGIFRFAPSGVSERGLAVLEVTPRGVNVISDSPQSFVGI